MPFWILVLIVAATWLAYPVAGAIGVAASVAEGTLPENTGFSFLPELILFPTLSVSAALLFDCFVDPVGSILIGGATMALFVWMMIASLQNFWIIRRHSSRRMD